LRDLLLAQRLAFRLWRVFDLALVNNVYGAFRTHNGDFRRGPREVGIGADVLAGHDAVCPAIRLARDYRQLGHRGLGKGEEQFGAVPDDAAELLLRAG